MGIVLYHGSGAGDFSVNGLNATDHISRYKHNVSDLLRIRGHRLALELLSGFPWQIREASNFFNDDFSVLVATVGLEKYEEARQFATSPEHKAAFRCIAETVTEIGPFIRFIAVELDPNRKPERTDSRTLTRKEIETLVDKYIGVFQGYLGDFSYRTHREFYADLELDINPDTIEGTTRVRFMSILSDATPDVQARILQGILEKYPVGSSPIRTQSMHDEVLRWIGRLMTGAAVATPKLNTTSVVVERALKDAERLMATTGATSGVDRCHTAFHGYLIQVCRDAKIEMGKEPSITQLFKLLRGRLPEFQNLGPRAEDIRKTLNSMASVVDILNPVRNEASIAHPNDSLLPEAEAMLVINSIRTLLCYLDSKLNTNQPRGT